MLMETTVVERAFQIAREGGYKCVRDIARRLSKESYDLAYQYLYSPTLPKQLKVLVAVRSACRVSLQWYVVMAVGIVGNSRPT
jgi:hypothetical protein